ncbi:hypothetical protein PF008_g14146 [Phytophthora fragariae]|uniref:Uncharacterized protein n=1 Tax=Phytophthora fragariae TaxID=53985 RepID=A0A6G0RHZ0_9STRA|nr:hypothetical protein PF008_g14146 [Phytophthora fragariae]
MTPEVPTTGRLHDDSENDLSHASSLERRDGGVTSVEDDESDATATIGQRRTWSLDDVEGLVMELLDDIAIAFGVFSSAINDGGDNEKESLFDEDPLEQHFHDMPLSPGVKVRAGDESNEGADLPLFASRMRRSTFAHMDTCTLPTPNSDPLSPRTGTAIPTNQHQVQPQKATFITETAWDLVSRNSADGQVIAHGRSHHLVPDCWGGNKSEDLSSAEPTASCSCSSSTSLTLFRRQSKVQRPCRSCSNPKAESTRTEAMNFTSVIKQRAFHLKPPCLPTSSSPSKRAPGASPRRITSAPAFSPLARRNLLISKRSTQSTNNRELESAATII